MLDRSNKEINYINHVKETTELTNVIKIKTFSFFYKNKFAVFNSNRLFLFND